MYFVYMVYCKGDTLYTGVAQDICRRMRRTKPELILMDVVLPGLDGFGILRQLAEEPGERKVIVISAFCSQQAVSRAVELACISSCPSPSTRSLCWS